MSQYRLERFSSFRQSIDRPSKDQAYYPTLRNYLRSSKPEEHILSLTRSQLTHLTPNAKLSRVLSSLLRRRRQTGEQEDQTSNIIKKSAFLFSNLHARYRPQFSNTSAIFPATTHITLQSCPAENQTFRPSRMAMKSRLLLLAEHRARDQV